MNQIVNKIVLSLERFAQSFYHFIFNALTQILDIDFVLRKFDGFVRTDPFKQEKFQNNVERARLLISRLNDVDIASGVANTHLLMVSRRGKDVLLNLWTAYFYILARARKLEGEGWEINSNWWLNADCAASHLYDHLFACLNDDDRHYVMSRLNAIFLHALGTYRVQEFKYGTSRTSKAI